ncbi:uncharacterized protein CBL_11392 [Carabus blaptoides fortunei]
MIKVKITTALLFLFVLHLDITKGVSIDLTDIHFLLYTKNNQKYPQQLFIDDDETLNLSDFKATRKTKVIIHEWGTGQRSINTTPIKQAYLKFGEFNVIVVDWHKYALLSYPASRKLVESIGTHIGQFLEFLILKTDVKISDLHIIGYGLGAQIAGNIGKLIHTIGRITALNPETKLFTEKDIDKLNLNDAKFVDVILTNANYSTAEDMGKLTLFVMSNKSDTDAGKYYAETIVNTTCVEAVQCDNLKDFNNCLCSANENICTGEFVTLNATGRYYMNI